MTPYMPPCTNITHDTMLSAMHPAIHGIERGHHAYGSRPAHEHLRAGAWGHSTCAHTHGQKRTVGDVKHTGKLRRAASREGWESPS